MANCPTLRNLLQGQICEENFAGLGSTAYVFLKKDLAKPLDHVGPIYQLKKNSFKESTGLFKIELKEESNSITGESQKKRGGFKQTCNLVVEVVNDQTADLLRALNNLDWCLIIPDGENYQLMYNTTNKVSIDAGGLKTETGAASSDDRNTTINVSLANCIYPNTFIEIEGDIEDYYVGDDFVVSPGGTGSVDEINVSANGKLFVFADESTLGSVKVNDQTSYTAKHFNTGEEITLEAVPAAGGKFDKWSNGSKTTKITVVATGGDQSFIAYFSPKS